MTIITQVRLFNELMELTEATTRITKIGDFTESLEEILKKYYKIESLE